MFRWPHSDTIASDVDTDCIPAAQHAVDKQLMKRTGHITQSTSFRLSVWAVYPLNTRYNHCFKDDDSCANVAKLLKNVWTKSVLNLAENHFCVTSKGSAKTVYMYSAGHVYNFLVLSFFRMLYTRNTAIAEKPRDAFRSQSTSPNMVPFHDRYGFLLEEYLFRQ